MLPPCGHKNFMVKSFGCTSCLNSFPVSTFSAEKDLMILMNNYYDFYNNDYSNNDFTFSWMLTHQHYPYHMHVSIIH